MASNFDPYWEWLKIPANQQPPNHYQLLGLKPLESNIEAIDAATNRLVEKMQRLSNGPQVEAAQRILNQVAQARLCFNDPGKKQIYDSQLTARLASQQGVSTSTAPLKPRPNNGRTANPERSTETPRNTAANPGATLPASPKPSPESKDKKTIEGNRQVQRMKIATAAMLVLGGTVGWLFVWFVSSKPAARPIAQQPVKVNRVESTNIIATNKPDVKATGQPPILMDTARSKAATPTERSSQTNDAHPQTQALSPAVMPVASDMGVDQSETNQGATRTAESTAGINPSAAAVNLPTTSAPTTTTPAPTITPAPKPAEKPPASASGLQTVSDLPDTYVPAKSSLFERHVDVVVGLQGQVVSARTSTTGKTVYLMFSAARDDLIEIRARAAKVSLESLQTFVGKKIRVRGKIKKEFGSRVIGLEIDTVEQIEIVK